MIQNQGCFQTKGCAILEQYETRKRRKGIKIIGGILLISFMLGIFLSAGGSSTPSEEYLAVLHIEGTMSENDGYTYDQQYLLDSVEELIQDKYNQGLLLCIDTPGGAVYQIDELYLKLMEYKENTGRPIYAAVESYAASGGYYVACAADKIYANRNAITGSIGVIMGEFIDVSGLLDQLGVDVSYVSTGANKAMGSSFAPLTEEQRAIYQAICDESYERFVAIISESRNMEEAAVRNLADGRIYTANQAVQNGMIDGIESFEDTLNRMKTDLGNADMEVWTYQYQGPAGLFDYLASGDIQKLADTFTGEKRLMENSEPPEVMMYFRGY